DEPSGGCTSIRPCGSENPWFAMAARTRCARSFVSSSSEGGPGLRVATISTSFSCVGATTTARTLPPLGHGEVPGSIVEPASDKIGTSVRFSVTTGCYGSFMQLTPAELTDAILQTAAIINTLQRRQLEHLAEYDRRELWKHDGATSMAAWITGVLGTGRDTAAETIRVAHAFEELPAIAATFEEG